MKNLISIVFSMIFALIVSAPSFVLAANEDNSLSISTLSQEETLDQPILFKKDKDDDDDDDDDDDKKKD